MHFQYLLCSFFSSANRLQCRCFFSSNSCFCSSVLFRKKSKFTVGWSEALDAALSHNGTIYVTRTLHYPKLLLKAEISPQEFNDTVVYSYYPAAYLSPRSFGRFRYVDDVVQPFNVQGVYLLWNGSPTEAFERAGFTVERFGCFELLYTD